MDGKPGTQQRPSVTFANFSFAIARDAPIGVVVRVFRFPKQRWLSQMFSWNLENDELTPGQMLKGRATVESISTDGRYVVCHIRAKHKPLYSYLTVSRPPYFTALALFPADQYRVDATFTGPRALTLKIWSEEQGGVSERIEPGCPLEITREDWVYPYQWKKSNDRDEARDRSIRFEDSEMKSVRGDEVQTIARFTRPEFQEISPPDWAKTW